jgi:tetratricopeptide (TPR) repeat protein
MGGGVFRAIGAIWFVVTLLVGPANASAYSDFNAGVALRVRDDNAAIQHLTSALADPTLLPSLRPVALLDRALCYARLKQYDASLADLDASLKLRPNYDAYLERTRVNFVLGHEDAALNNLDSAVALRPDLLVARVVRANMLLQRDRFDDALTDENALIAQAPRDPTLYSLRSAIYRRQGKLDAALADADYAIKIAPSVANGYYARVSALEASGRLDEAVAASNLELERFPNSIYATLKKGMILWEMKKFDEAEGAFTDAAKMNATNGYAALWRLIAHRSSHPGDDLDVAIFAKVDMVAWPGPLIGLFRGTESLTTATQAASADASKKRGQLCELNFYAAQWHLLNGRPDAAKPLLQSAVRDCPYDFVERAAALVQTQP